jgi:hypothetical protein
VEQGVLLSPSVVDAIATEYDQVIHGLVTTRFGGLPDLDENGRVILLLLDVQDGFAGEGGYVGGFFDGIHQYSTVSYPESNEADMLFLDVDPLVPGSDVFLSTIVHELQHMASFQRAVERGGGSPLLQDTWINEGLSLSAEYLYVGDQLSDRIAYFNDDPQGAVQDGDTFYVWGNQDVLADYASAYLFFQWLRIQASDGEGIYRAIFDSSFRDYRAVEAAALTRLGDSADTWGELYPKWLQANLLNKASGLQGYGGAISTVTVRDHDQTGGAAALAPGETLYDTITLSFAPTGEIGADIRYQGISLSGVVDEDSDSDGDYEGVRLIAFNSSTSTSSTTQNAVIPTASLTESFESRSAPGSRSFAEEPYRIDVRIPLPTDAPVR